MLLANHSWCERTTALVPYGDVQLLDHFVARWPNVQIDVVKSAFLHIEEAQRVRLLLMEWPFAERAIELQPWLRN